MDSGDTLINCPDDDFAVLTSNFRASIVVSTRRVGFRIFKNCVSGKDITLWLSARRYLPPSLSGPDRASVLKQFGQRLLRDGTLTAIGNKHTDLVDDEAVFFLLPNRRDDTMGQRANSSRSLSSRSRASIEFLRFGSASAVDASSSRGLRRSLDAVPRRVRNTPSSGVTSPTASADVSVEASVDSSMSDEGFVSPPFQATSPTNLYMDKPPLPEKRDTGPQLSSTRITLDGQALRRASLDLALGNDIDDDDDEHDLVSGSYDTSDEFASNEDMPPRSFSRIGSGIQRATGTNSMRSSTKRSGAPASLTKRLFEDMKQSQQRQRELRDNTVRNRSSKSVQEILVARRVQSRSMDMEERLQTAKSMTGKNAIPLVNSQLFDPGVIRQAYTAGTKLSFNERVHVRKLDEDGNVIENLRVPIDYSIKRKLVEPRPEPQPTPGVADSEGSLLA